MQPLKINRSNVLRSTATTVADLRMAEWETEAALPDVVRLTFKAFHDVLRVQGESIKNLERALDSKASRSEVS